MHQSLRKWVNRNRNFLKVQEFQTVTVEITIDFEGISLCTGELCEPLWELGDMARFCAPLCHLLISWLRYVIFTLLFPYLQNAEIEMIYLSMTSHPMIEGVEIVEPNLSISPSTTRAVLVIETMMGRRLTEKRESWWREINACDNPRHYGIIEKWFILLAAWRYNMHTVVTLSQHLLRFVI